MSNDPTAAVSVEIQYVPFRCYYSDAVAVVRLMARDRLQPQLEPHTLTFIIIPTVKKELRGIK